MLTLSPSRGQFNQLRHIHVLHPLLIHLVVSCFLSHRTGQVFGFICNQYHAEKRYYLNVLSWFYSKIRFTCSLTAQSLRILKRCHSSVPVRADWSDPSQKPFHTWPRLLTIKLGFDPWSRWYKIQAVKWELLTALASILHMQEKTSLFVSATSKLLIVTLNHLCWFLFQSAHLAMIDTLMMAYTVETVSVDKVMACIRQYPSCDPEVETPYDTEDAVTTWINKVGNCICKQLCISACIMLSRTYDLGCLWASSWVMKFLH